MKKGCTDHHNYISHLEKELHRTKELARELFDVLKKISCSGCPDQCMGNCPQCTAEEYLKKYEELK